MIIARLYSALYEVQNNGIAIACILDVNEILACIICGHEMWECTLVAKVLYDHSSIV